MTLEQACRDYRGTSDFRIGRHGAAVWFHEEGGAVWKMAWQGRSVIRFIQRSLGVSEDGVWGRETQDALRAAMERMHQDVSLIRNGAIDRMTLAAALAVSYTLNTMGSDATTLATRVCMPVGTVLPLWLTSPASDGSAAIIETAVDVGAGTPAPPAPWRRPANSVVLDAGFNDSDLAAITYRLESGQIRHALLRADRSLVEDREATADEIAAANALGTPGATLAPAVSALDPGTLAPGEVAVTATPSPRASGYGQGITTSSKRPYLIVGVTVTVVLLGLLAAAFAASAVPPPPPPTPPPNPRAARAKSPSRSR